MTPPPNLPRPEGLSEVFLRVQPWVELYCEPAMPGLRGAWSYFLLAERRSKLGEMIGGAAAMTHYQHGLVQSFSFSAAEMEALRRKLSLLSLPVWCEASMWLDGDHGWVRLHSGHGTHTDLCWTGGPPEAWEPLMNWIGEVKGMILEKMWDDAVKEPGLPPISEPPPKPQRQPMIFISDIRSSLRPPPPAECADEEL
jgi:hypothetical protein